MNGWEDRSMDCVWLLSRFESAIESSTLVENFNSSFKLRYTLSFAPRSTLSDNVNVLTDALPLLNGPWIAQSTLKLM